MKATPEEFTIQSEVNHSSRYFLVFGAFFFGGVTYMMSDVIYQKPPDLFHVIILLIGAGFTLWSLTGFWIYFDHIKVFSDRLESTNFGGRYNRTIYFSDIEEIKKSHKSRKYESWDELVLLQKNGRTYKVYSTSYRNYNEIEAVITRKTGLPIGSEKSEKDKNKSVKISIVVLFLMFIACATTLVWLYDASSGAKKQDLESVALTLDAKPSIQQDRKGRAWLELKIREYPDFDFDIAGSAYKFMDAQNFVDNTQAGSRITLSIDKGDYHQKLVRDEEATFWKKYFRYRLISIYELKDQNHVYLSFRHYEHEMKNDYKWGMLGMIGFLIYLIYGGYVAWQELKEIREKAANR